METSLRVSVKLDVFVALGLVQSYNTRRTNNKKIFQPQVRAAVETNYHVTLHCPKTLFLHVLI